MEPKINASITIVDGKIKVSLMQKDDKHVTDENDQLVIIRDVVLQELINFEKNFQKQFIPTKNTIYNLPKDI